MWETWKQGASAINKPLKVCKVETGTQTSHSSEVNINNNEHESKTGLQVDRPPQTDAHQSLFNCNKNGSEDFSAKDKSEKDFKASATDLDILSEKTEGKNDQKKEHNDRIDDNKEGNDHSVNKIDVDLIYLEENLKEKKKYFETLKEYVVPEKKALEFCLEKIANYIRSKKNYLSLHDIHNSFCKRTKDANEKLATNKVHPNILHFVLHICHTVQTLCKNAVSEVKRSSKFADARYKNLKEILDWVKDYLKSCVGSINATLDRIKLMLENLQPNEIEKGLFAQKLNTLAKSYKKCKQKNADNIKSVPRANNNISITDAGMIQFSVCYRNLFDEFDYLNMTKYKAFIDKLLSG